MRFRITILFTVHRSLTGHRPCRGRRLRGAGGAVPSESMAQCILCGHRERSDRFPALERLGSRKCYEKDASRHYAILRLRGGMVLSQAAAQDKKTENIKLRNCRRSFALA